MFPWMSWYWYNSPARQTVREKTARLQKADAPSGRDASPLRFPPFPSPAIFFSFFFLDNWLVLIGYPSGQDGPILLGRDFPLCSRKSEIIWCNPVFTKGVWSRWLDICLVLFFTFLWTSTSFRSIKTQKKNLANIQPSWPHAWSITYVFPKNTTPRPQSALNPESSARTISTPRLLLGWGRKLVRSTTKFVTIMWLLST